MDSLARRSVATVNPTSERAATRNVGLSNPAAHQEGPPALDPHPRGSLDTDPTAEVIVGSFTCPRKAPKVLETGPTEPRQHYGCIVSTTQACRSLKRSRRLAGQAVNGRLAVLMSPCPPLRVAAGAARSRRASDRQPCRRSWRAPRDGRWSSARPSHPTPRPCRTPQCAA